MTEAKHLPLDTPMIHWPRLGDVLDEVMHNIERNVWDQEFENRADLTDDLKDREPDSMSRCLTDLETILETAPRLREVLDEARCSYEIPDHAWNILDTPSRDQSSSWRTRSRTRNGRPCWTWPGSPSWEGRKAQRNNGHPGPAQSPTSAPAPQSPGCPPGSRSHPE